MLTYADVYRFLMAPKDFATLREKAKDTLEPGSAFMFFEQQMEELVTKPLRCY